MAIRNNELMIGDWAIVHGPADQRFTRKLDIGDLSFFVEFEPIPITPEILEKNGFERRDDLVEDGFLPFIIDSLNAEECYEIIVEWKDSYDNGAVDAFNVEAWEESWKLHIGCKMNTYISTADVIFVHELQHAIKLCGIDKEIVL